MGTHLTVSIPTFNRTSLLFEALEYPLMDDRVSEIIVYDDHSDETVYNAVSSFCANYDKIKLYRGSKNLDCYKAKREAVSLATNEYVALIDSDNRISKDYLDKIFETPWSPERILQPTFARPHFDFRKFNSLLAHKTNVAKYATDSTFTTALNAMNYFLNRDEYLRVWDSSVDPVTSDSIFQNYNWLKAGNSIYFTPGLEYEHLVHNGSHYQQNNKRTPKGFHESIIKKLKELR